MKDKNIILQMYVNENLGDDLFLDIMVKRYPNIHFTLYGIGNRLIPNVYDTAYSNVSLLQTSSTKQKLNTIKKVLFKKDNLLDKALKQSDGLVTLGGSVFLDHPGGFAAYKDKVLSKVRTNSLKVGKPTFVIGANFGPVYHESFTQTYNSYFDSCNDVCFRDEKSKALFKDNPKCRASKDVIFTLPPTNQPKKDKTVGISVMDFGDGSHASISSYKEAYESQMVKLVKEFLKEGYEVTLYGFCIPQGDKRVMDTIISEIGESKHLNVCLYQNLAIESFLNDFTANQYIVATRFHAMILGLIHNQQVYTIVYDTKTQNVIDDLDLKDYCTLDSIENLTLENVLKAQITQNISKYQLEAQSQFEGFEKYYG